MVPRVVVSWGRSSFGRLVLAAAVVVVVLAGFGTPRTASGQTTQPEPPIVPVAGSEAVPLPEEIAPPATEVAPAPVAAPKRIVVSLGMQYLWAYEGDVAVWESYVSTGKAGFETPLGLFYVGAKYEVDRMAGTLGGETYDIPDVPDVMYFTDVGHALHGAYWHNNFGVPMSHGCINLPLDLADWLFAWAPVGTPVEIVP